MHLIIVHKDGHESSGTEKNYLKSPFNKTFLEKKELIWLKFHTLCVYGTSAVNTKT